eukprot:Lithocolla_globosa_v1_NODE_7128_length_988_cov_42.852090.p1 type:complete len:303 gc:universal NODE_7128_length_988_cov_42.852090:986-78(-)
MADDRPCPGEMKYYDFVIGMIVFSFSILTFAFQHIKIWKRKSHVGISFVWIIFSVLGSVSNFTNYLITQYHESFECCPPGDFYQCLANLLPLLNVVVLLVANLILLFQYNFYFDILWLRKHGYEEQKHLARTRGWTFFTLTYCLGCGIATGLMAEFYTIYGEALSYLGFVLVTVAAVCMVLQWIPQIYETYKLKRLGSLSLLLVFLSGSMAWMPVYFMALTADWYVWLPQLLAFVMAFILLVECTYYYYWSGAMSQDLLAWGFTCLPTPVVVDESNRESERLINPADDRNNPRIERDISEEP